MNVISVVETITPERAQEMLSEWHFQRQRKLDKSHADHLGYEMGAEHFIPATQVYVCRLPDGRCKLVNGQHTLTGIVSSGVPVVLTITMLDVADEAEAGRIYSVFDTGKRRSWGQSAKATADLDGIPDLNSVIAAVGVIMRKFTVVRYMDPQAQDRPDRFEAVADYREAAEKLMEATKGGRYRNLVRRSGAMAVALETFKHQPDKAELFWGSIAHDITEAGSGARALKNWLQDTKRTGGDLGQREHALAAAAGWNAAFRGQLRAYVQPNGLKDFYLLGTPWAAPAKSKAA